LGYFSLGYGCPTHYTYLAGLKTGKSEEVIGAIKAWHAAMTARSVRPLVLITDGGGEFLASLCKETYAGLSS
jgi:hypothetical protein